MSRIENRIIYYDFSDLNYTSFFIQALLESEIKHNFKLCFSKKAPNILFEEEDWKDSIYLLPSIALFKYKSKDDSFFFCIDARDSNSSKKDKGEGYYLPLLRKVRYYFKVNYNQEMIHNEKELNLFSTKIIPILPFFPVKFRNFPLYFPKLLPDAKLNWNLYKLKERYKFILNNISVEELKNYRLSRKTRDVFFVSIYRSSKIHEKEINFRFEIMQHLKKEKGLNSLIGFVGPQIPKSLNEFKLEGFNLKEYLGEVSQSRLAIYTRGLHDSISYKFGQFLTMGMPVIGQKLINNQENLYSLKYFDRQFAFENPREIADNVRLLLDDTELLKDIGESNAAVFDKYLNPGIIGDFILNQLIAKNNY